MKDVFEILQEEARARRASLRDDGEPLDLALARSRQQAMVPVRRLPTRYLPAAGMAVGTLCVSAVVLIDFERKYQVSITGAALAASVAPAPPTVVIGYSPATYIASESYEAPVQIINTQPIADRVAIKMKKDDPRLLIPMQGTWKRARLRRIANEITARTGIRFTIAPELAEKRVTVFAGEKASTLQVLRGVAHLYESGWFRNESGPPYTYHLRRFDTPQTRGWLNALYQSPERHAPGMDDIITLPSPTHMDWLEQLHQKTRRTIISDDTNLGIKGAPAEPQPLFKALSNRASSAGQLWDNHAGALTFRKADPEPLTSAAPAPPPMPAFSTTLRPEPQQ